MILKDELYCTTIKEYITYFKKNKMLFNLLVQVPKDSEISKLPQEAYYNEFLYCAFDFGAPESYLTDNLIIEDNVIHCILVYKGIDGWDEYPISFPLLGIIVGVSLNKTMGKWEANITVNMNPIKLGFFTDIHLAIKAREEAEKKYNFHPNHGENCINYEYINKMQKYIHNNKKGETNRIAVAQYSKENQLIKVFESAKQAEELTGTNRGHISAVCKGKRKTANNFIWKYCEPFIGELPTILQQPE